MNHALIATHPPRRISAFDEVVIRYAETKTSFSEEKASSLPALREIEVRSMAPSKYSHLFDV